MTDAPPITKSDTAQPLEQILREGKNWLNSSKCCGQVCSAGVCAAPACIFGEALKYFHLAADEIDRLHDLRRASEKQIAELREALDVREMWSNPDDFDKAADEIDCGRGCAALWVEYDTNASGCRNAERGDYCPNDVAETLREVGKLARAARKAYDGSEPR